MERRLAEGLMHRQVGERFGGGEASASPFTTFAKFAETACRRAFL